MPEFLFVSFADYTEGTLDLAVKIKESYQNQPPLDYLISIQQGGAIISKILSDIFSLPVGTIVASSYRDLNKTKKPFISQDVSVDVTGKHILVVDDVSDTGDTLQLVKEHLGQRSPASVKTATLFIKPEKTHFLPDFWSMETDKWIVFPGELQETAKAMREIKDIPADVLHQFTDFAKAHGATDSLREKLDLNVV
jgi:hypoxanthine phosphoribosyltransferase